MNPEYFSIYNNFDLLQSNLQQKIQSSFPYIDLKNDRLTYQQILLILDEKCEQFFHNNIHIHKQNDNMQVNTDGRMFRKANRNISREIFDGCASENRTNLRSFIVKYIQLLETSKLCLMRQNAKKQILESRIKQAEKHVRNCNYLHIKLIQATIHSRYSNNPCFQYKIQPSNIPTITIVNSLNPILNHQYTLKMDSDQFYIIFYESGVEIYKWRFQLNTEDDGKKNGEYFRSISTQSITFEVQIKVLPAGMSEELTMLKSEIQGLQERIIVSDKAFYQLCYYMPMLQVKKNQIQTEKISGHNFTKSLFSCLPFMRNHVKILHDFLIALMFVECLAAVSWAVQFIDIIIVFVMLGLLYDRSKFNISMQLWIGFFALILSVMKTIWGALLAPFGIPKYPLILGISILFKIILLLLLWITLSRHQQISQQRVSLLYNVKKKQPSVKIQQNQPIFKANQNYYLNKKMITK